MNVEFGKMIIMVMYDVYVVGVVCLFVYLEKGELIDGYVGWLVVGVCVMYVLKLIVCNVLWYWLCMFLIVFGFMIVVFVFGLLYIVVDVWYVGVVVVFSGWFVMCNVILLVFLLLVSYENCICGVDGVMVVVCLNWFGGIYCDLKNFFVSFVVLENYFDLYLEFILLV